MKYNVFMFNVSSIVGLKITTECWLLVKGTTRFHFRPYMLVCDHFKVLQGQKIGQKKAQID